MLLIQQHMIINQYHEADTEVCVAVSRLIKKPDYILLENVQGFEKSLSRRELLRVLQHMDFSFQVKFRFLLKR